MAGSSEIDLLELGLEADIAARLQRWQVRTSGVHARAHRGLVAGSARVVHARHGWLGSGLGRTAGGLLAGVVHAHGYGECLPLAPLLYYH